MAGLSLWSDGDMQPSADIQTEIFGIKQQTNRQYVVNQTINHDNLLQCRNNLQSSVPLTSSIFVAEIRKTPDVSQSNRKANEGKNEVELSCPCFTFVHLRSHDRQTHCSMADCSRCYALDERLESKVTICEPPQACESCETRGYEEPHSEVCAVYKVVE